MRNSAFSTHPQATRPQATRLLQVTLLLVTMSGCGSAGPDVAAVKKNMTSEQLELGDPLLNSVDMILVPLPAGEFRMGNPAKKGKPNEKGKPARPGPESPQRQVRISSPFYISVSEITQQQYELVMGERPWEGQPLVKEGADYAASYITWQNAVDFCRKLSEQEQEEYRLPTEAEWEYACRAETQTTWSFGDEYKALADHAWFDVNAYKDGEQYAHRVGLKKPNAWALHDMHGNVWEWCQDWYGGYSGAQKVSVDPQGPKKGHVRVWRGGSFASAALNSRSASRISYGRVGYRPEYLAGFRVVRSFKVDK